MSKLDEFQEVHRYILKFEVMQRWMNDDLKRSTIQGKANLLVTMGLFNYIEILGAFYRFSSTKKRFNFTINELLPKSYKNVCSRIDKLTTDGVYDTLRCGMTHEYLVKTGKMRDKSKKLRFTVVGSDSEEDFELAIKGQPCGLKLVNKGGNYRLYIINARFIYDLNIAFNTYKDKIKNDVKGYRKYFLKRSKEVGLELL